MDVDSYDDPNTGEKTKPATTNAGALLLEREVAAAQASEDAKEEKQRQAAAAPASEDMRKDNAP